MNPLHLLPAAAAQSEAGRNMAGTPQACRAAVRVVDAATALYMAGKWSAGLPANLEARMWEDLRDALGLTPGTATEAGVGAQCAHGCPACDDAMECDCEQPLPMFDAEPTPLRIESPTLRAAFDRPGAEL